MRPVSELPSARPEAIADFVDDPVAIGAPALRLRLSIRNEPAVARAREAGTVVVAGRPIGVEHAHPRRS